VELPFVSATRRNHAVEHATIAVLFRRRGHSVSVVAHSDPRGFTIRGPFNPEEVESAATEAIARLRAGESHLAVTPLCGTNIAVAALLSGAAAILGAGSGRRNWPRALTASLLAMLVSGGVGLRLQRYVTTDANTGDVRVAAVSLRRRRGTMNLVRVRLRS
jgi:hypothetical protein